MVAQELTDIDGIDRSDAEVIAVSEDWSGEEADALAALKAQIAAEMLPDLTAKVLSQVAATMAAADSKPALAMKAHVAQDFIERANGEGTLLKHYRCDRMGSEKMIVYDMNLMRQYQSGERPVPEDKDTGRPKKIETLCVIPGEWISWLDGHCYVYSQNHVDNVERLRTLPRSLGGAPDIYEDTGAATWQCFTCQPPRQFSDKITHDNHMRATHDPAYRG